MGLLYPYLTLAGWTSRTSDLEPRIPDPGPVYLFGLGLRVWGSKSKPKPQKRMTAFLSLLAEMQNKARTADLLTSSLAVFSTALHMKCQDIRGRLQISHTKHINIFSRSVVSGQERGWIDRSELSARSATDPLTFADFVEPVSSSWLTTCPRSDIVPLDFRFLNHRNARRTRNYEFPAARIACE